MRLGVAFHTLGCKLNQLESDALADSFRAAGAALVPSRDSNERIDLLVLNTCTVTSKAEQKARRLVHALLRGHPDAVVLITGCYAQLDRAGLEALHERAVVVPGDEKAGLLELASWLAEFWQGHGDLLEAVREWRVETTQSPGRATGRGRFSFNPASLTFHSRPALKVQDGCDNRCSYCRVCLARGSSQSLEAEEVLTRAQALEAAGRAEIVLTGVNLSQYRDGARDFPALLSLLLKGTATLSFRISSYEPDRVNDAFLAVFAEERVRPHVHLAVQSGSDPVLSRMGRPYRAAAVRGAIDRLRQTRADPFLAADIIAGFPGETDEEFESTLELCRDAGFAWIHAFPFSPRPGTRAEALRPRVPERVAGERVAQLQALARAGRSAYAARWVGHELEAVLEGRGGSFCEEGEDYGGGMADSLDSVLRQATSANYLKLRLEGVPGHKPAGSSLRCRPYEAVSLQAAGFDARAVIV